MPPVPPELVAPAAPALAELPAMLGRSTGDLAAELGPSYQREVIHRDDLVLL